MYIYHVWLAENVKKIEIKLSNKYEVQKIK